MSCPILPFGINSLGGQIAGYVCSSAGLIALLVGVIKGCINRRHNTDVESVMHTYYLAEASEMGSYFPNRLLPDELFAVQDSLRKIITIYGREWNADDNCYERISPITMEYNVEPQTAFQEWCSNNAEIVQGKRFIDLNTLNQRTQDFERTRKVHEDKND